MRRTLFALFVIVSLFSLSALPAAAQGIIIMPPGIDTDPRSLTIDHHRVRVDIQDQIATTSVDLKFTNRGERLAEGTFIFPLPRGAAVERLTMIIDGLAIEARILRAEEARQIYNEIVQQYRDPALLEYIGSDLLQASIFPIPPGESRQVQITYGQVLEAENGLIRYVYPMHQAGRALRSTAEMSISLSVDGQARISNVYSPSHNLAVSRTGDTAFRAGFEALDYMPNDDFVIYYGLARETIDANLLSYLESADEDGFFMLMLQPPFEVEETQVQPKDVIIVLDQSGSMAGPKWEQAQQAAQYVLSQLNSRDRFNVVAFSTGWRLYADELVDSGDAQDASQWIKRLSAEGATDIHGAISTAMSFAQERPMTILFLTDGLATEGLTSTPDILASLNDQAPSNVRLFTFGVGDDVDTLLLDALVRDFRGTGTYVRPYERIDEEVASLYNKISAPVLTDITLEIDGVRTELVYPEQLPDLFAGEQLTLVGRYRLGSGSDTTITLSGDVNGLRQTFIYDGQSFRNRAGGEPFLARLWAARRIGDLLNRIRLNGENPELVDSVVSLSIRYGIITPYTSFLIEEDDILSQQGRQAALDSFAEEAENLASMSTGADAVTAADAAANLSRAQSVPLPAAAPLQEQQPMGGAMPSGTQSPLMAPGEMAEAEVDGFAYEEPSVNPVQTVGSRTFILQGETWTDTTYEPDAMEAVEVIFLSDAYFDLLARFPEAAPYLALGEDVIVVLDGTAYHIQPEA